MLNKQIIDSLSFDFYMMSEVFTVDIWFFFYSVFLKLTSLPSYGLLLIQCLQSYGLVKQPETFLRWKTSLTEADCEGGCISFPLANSPTECVFIICVAGENGKGKGSESAEEKWGLGVRDSPPFFSRVLAPLPLPRLRLPHRLCFHKKLFIIFILLGFADHMDVH